MRIISEKKTRLPSLRNQDWKTVKAKTEKINELLIHLNEKHNKKLCRGEISLLQNQCSLKEHKQKLKTWMKNSTGNVDKKWKKSGTCWDEKEKVTQQVKQKIQLEGIN